MDGVQGVASSNPAVPTNEINGLAPQGASPFLLLASRVTEFQALSGRTSRPRVLAPLQSGLAEGATRISR